MAEAWIGDFIFNILAYPINGKTSPAISLIQAALKNDDDDISRLIKPLITNSYKARVISLEVSAHDIIMNNSMTAIRRGFDNLAINMRHIGQADSSLLVLKRMVNLAMFSAFFYLVDVNYSIYAGDRIPLMLDSASNLDAIERASELSFISCKKSVEAYIVNILEDIIREDCLISDINA